MSNNFCHYCCEPLPLGCGNFAGKSPNCKVGPRTDLPWKIGFAIWMDLTDRCGIKHELNKCNIETKVEIVETMGRLALEEIEKFNNDNKI